MVRSSCRGAVSSLQHPLPASPSELQLPVPNTTWQVLGMRAGIPQSDTLRFYEGFVASFDSRTRNPKWVLEYISRDSLRGEGTRCGLRGCTAAQCC